MNTISPEPMLENIKDLPKLINDNTIVFSQSVEKALTEIPLKSIKFVYIIGNGDSYHASLGSEYAFECIAGITANAITSQKFLDYKISNLPENLRQSTLIIGISASGGTKRVVQSLTAAKELGFTTLALTGRPDSAVTKLADTSVVLELPAFPISPGIRSYVATLMGLYLIAVKIGQRNGNYSEKKTSLLIEELKNTSIIVEKTIELTEKVAKRAADNFVNHSSLMFLGSGPSFGTAIFSAAKVIEACGVFSMGQDLEEWSHVEFFAYPSDMPTFIVAPPGKSFWRALEIAEMVKNYGHKLVVITSDLENEIVQYADYVFPIAEGVREELSSIVYHIGADFFAAYLTIALGRHPFRSDDEDFREKNMAYQKRDRIRL
jgi:glucosamine--fructose-6-phosphate aminotransferase (isomerizing)